MMLPDDMYAATPPNPDNAGKGKKPKLLTDEKVKVLLATPSTWYVIGSSEKWISGTAKNIMSFGQNNISHLKDLGRFDVLQRKDKESSVINIYCRWVPIADMEQE